MSWRIFEQAAGQYEGWYATRRGRHTDIAERALLEHLLAAFDGARTLLEVGCGTGHFTAWLAQRGYRVIGLERAPAMLTEAHRRSPRVRLVLGDAHDMPIGDRSVDLVIFVTTLEFLEDPAGALREAARVARRGIVAIVLNRHSLGGLSRRWGRQSRATLLGRSRDYSLGTIRSALRDAAGFRQCELRELRWMSTLFPGFLWNRLGRVPLGDVIGMTAILAQ